MFLIQTVMHLLINKKRNVASSDTRLLKEFVIEVRDIINKDVSINFGAKKTNEKTTSERMMYLEYLKNFFEEDETIIVYDAVSSGTIAYGLEKILNRKIKLFCFIGRQVTEYSVLDELNVSCYVGKDFKFINEFYISKRIDILESILTSKEPSFICINESGEIIYGENDKKWIK